jgi:spore coat protein U-like protein
MRSGANVLNYNLFTDPTHLSMWGDGSGGTAIVAGSGTGSVTNVPVYGRVPGSQSVPSGSYADDIVITVNF